MSVSNYVVLKGGLIVPMTAVLLALDLETAGCHLRIDEDDALVVSPRELLSDIDRAQIRLWRTHLKAIVSYEVPGVQ